MSIRDLERAAFIAGYNAAAAEIEPLVGYEVAADDPHAAWERYMAIPPTKLPSDAELAADRLPG